MSASKLSNADVFRPVTVQSRTTRLDLPASAIKIRKNGIEFRSATAIPAWTEMTVALKGPLDPRKLNCTGIVVACPGNRHSGYLVSMVFMNLTRQEQARLDLLAYATLA